MVVIWIQTQTQGFMMECPDKSTVTSFGLFIVVQLKFRHQKVSNSVVHFIFQENIDSLYLDNTFFFKEYDFPTRYITNSFYNTHCCLRYLFSDSQYLIATVFMASLRMQEVGRLGNSQSL